MVLDSDTYSLEGRDLLMSRIWYDPETKRIHYDSTAKKVLTTGYPCSECVDVEQDTPDAVKVTWEGLLCCAGVGECGLGGYDRYKFTDLGIGLNGEATLLRGRHEWNETTGKWDYYGPEGESVWGYCYWSQVVYDDFGTYQRYNLDECGGGVQYTVHLTSRRVMLMRGGTYWHIRVTFRGPKGSPPPPTGVSPAFDYYENDGWPWEDWCVPYGEYDNMNVCPDKILGEGSITIAEV